MNPRSHEHSISLRSSGLMVLVSSTVRFRSLAEVSRQVWFHLALASRSSFRARALARSFAESTCCLNNGLTSRLFCPFRTIFKLSRDWSILFLSCEAVRAERSRCSLSKRSEFCKNLSLRILNSVFGNLPKCASNGDILVVFCLLQRRSRSIVLKHNFIDVTFSSSSITPNLLLMVCIVRSTKPHPRWSPTGQNFCSMLLSEQNFFIALPLNPEN